MSLLLIIHIALSLFLITIILTNKATRQACTYWFVINAVLANLLFSLVVRPGTVQWEIEHEQVAHAYCGAFVILHQVEQLLVPAMLLMFNVDRMMYVRDPNSYGQRMKLSVIVAMLLVPWIASLALGLISVHGFLGEVSVSKQSSVYNRNATVHTCGVSYEKYHNSQLIYQAVLCLILALASLMVTVLILVFWCRFRRAAFLNRAYSQLEAETATSVRKAFVIVCVLNLAFLFLFISHFLIVEFLMFLNTHLIYFVFELLEVIFFVTLLPELSSAAQRLCCRCRKRDVENEETTLRYVANSEDSYTPENHGAL